MKNCNIIWVVADIHRAVDNKTAKDLLGESFRRQLYMDGQYGNVAFICTKTDTSIVPAEVMRYILLSYYTSKGSIRYLSTVHIFINSFLRVEGSEMVRAFAHGVMGRRIDPSGSGPIELFLVPASAPRLV